MANPMSGIGTGIALSGGSKFFEGLIGRRMDEERAARQAKTKEDMFIDIDKDLKDDNKDRLPLYSQQAVQVHKDLINDYGNYKKQGLTSAQAQNMVSRDLYKYQQRLNDINIANDAAQRYLKADSGTQLTGDRAKAQQVFFNRDARPEDLKALHNQDYGMMAGDNYQFAYSPKQYTEIGDLVKKFDDGDYDINNPKKGKVVNLGNHMEQEVAFPFIPSQKAVENAKRELLSGNDGGNLAHFKYDIYPNLPEEYKALPEYKDFNNPNPDIRVKAQDALAERVIRNSMHKPDRLGSMAYTVPQPTEGEKNKEWRSQGGTVQNDKNVWHYDKNEAGTEIFTFSKTNPAENMALDLKKGGEVVKGVPVRMEITKNSKSPIIYVAVTKKEEYQDADGNARVVDKVVEVPIAYTPYNASKIENEYGQNPYKVRKIVTGTLSPDGETMTGSTKGKTDTKSENKSSGSSEVKRRTADGKIAIFNADTKEFIRYE